jgi:hypothetical protein
MWRGQSEAKGHTHWSIPMASYRLATAFALGAAVISFLLLAPARARAESAAPPAVQINLLIYGDDPCPAPADAEEIVVCARQPESERFRIPPRLRARPDRPSEVSWASRAAGLEEESRQMRPNSCSVVGSGGQSGCNQAMIRQWYDERRAARSQ